MSLEHTPEADPSPAELATAAAHRPSLWRQGDFMKLWTGQTISQFGDEITMLALPFVAILTLGAEARASSGAEDPSMALVVRARMPAARARRFARLVELLAAEFADGAPQGGEAFGFAAAVYVPDWASGEKA